MMQKCDTFSNNPNPNITVLGMGYIGLPTSVLFASAGFSVRGFDICEATIAKLRKGTITIVEPHLQELFSLVLQRRTLEPTTELALSDIFVICVPTPFVIQPDGSRSADLEYVRNAASIIAPYLCKGNVVVLESTVPPGTTREILVPILEEHSGLVCGRDFSVAHCPERVLPGNMMAELRSNDRIIGVSDEATGEYLKKIYRRIVTEGEIFLTDERTAELCKLVENTYRDVNIAFANELSMICQEMEIDVWKLISLANRHPRVNIMKPGPGVGGHCLAVDPWFIVEKAPQSANLIRLARETNEKKTAWVIRHIQKAVEQAFPEEAQQKTIGILGLSYKPNIDDLRESPALQIAKALQKEGYTVLGCEPHVQGDCYEGIPLISLNAMIDRADFLVYAVAHGFFKEAQGLINAKPCFDAVGELL